MKIDTLDFDKLDGLIPSIIQHHQTGQVLMLGFMNKEALTKTIADGRVTYYSRSKKRLWTKGETSGNYLKVIKITPDCDRDTLLIKAEPLGPVCHTGTATCFGDHDKQHGLSFLETIIQDRKANPKADSYTNQLLDKGINKVAQKVGEEAVELVIESKDENKELFVNEAADLMYHFLVLLAAKDVTLADVEEVLKERHVKK